MFGYRSNSSAEWIFSPFLSIVRVPFAPISLFPSLDYSCLFRRLFVSLPLDYSCPFRSIIRPFRSVIRLSSARLFVYLPLGCPSVFRSIAHSCPFRSIICVFFARLSCLPFSLPALCTPLCLVLSVPVYTSCLYHSLVSVYNPESDRRNAKPAPELAWLNLNTMLPTKAIAYQSLKGVLLSYVRHFSFQSLYQAYAQFNQV